MHATSRVAIWSMITALAVVGTSCGSQEQLDSVPTDGSSASSAPSRTDEPVSVTVGEPGSTDSTVASDSSAPPASGATTSDGTGSGSSTGPATSGSNGAATTATTVKPPAKQTITIAPIPGGWVYGDSRTVIAVASSNLPIGLSASGACQVVNAAIGLVQATDVGECRVMASQAGGNGYSPATPVTATAQIAKASPTIGNFGGRTIEHPRTPFSIPLTATASGGATVQYRVLPDGYDVPLCVVTGNALAVSQPDGLPRDCVVEAYVDASSRYEAAVAQATFVINPTVVKFTGESGPAIGPSSASVSVTLNRVWGIEYGSDCGSTSASPASGASSYTITVQFDDPNLIRPFSCSVDVTTSAPDGAVTTDPRHFPIDVQ